MQCVISLPEGAEIQSVQTVTYSQIVNESSTTITGGNKRKALNDYWTEYLVQATKTAKVQEQYYRLKMQKIQGHVETTSGLLIYQFMAPQYMDIWTINSKYLDTLNRQIVQWIYFP